MDFPAGYVSHNQMVALGEAQQLNQQLPLRLLPGRGASHGRDQGCKDGGAAVTGRRLGQWSRGPWGSMGSWEDQGDLCMIFEIYDL